MKIAIDPNWTFLEALNAAWDTYSGGQEFGATNRIRVLEQWANVVGRERALTDFESVLRVYPSLEEASKHIGLSVYAIKKLRKSFNDMPENKIYLSESSTLYNLLRSLPGIGATSALGLLSYIVQRLATILGFSPGELQLEPSITGAPHLRPDAILSISETHQPYIVIEIKNVRSDENQNIDSAKNQLEEYLRISGAEIGVIFSPDIVGILHDGSFRTYRIRSLTESHAEEIEQLLRRPIQQPISPRERPEGVSTILHNLLMAVVAASTNQEKKRSLETLAAKVFEAHPFLRCKYKNLRTKSSEIDIVCEYKGSNDRSFLDEYGRYFLVECKNWSRPAGAKEIRDFLGKLRKTRVRLGVFFSKSGITGEARGTDALREIHSAYDREEIYVVVLSDADFRSIETPSEVLYLIDAKLDALRFDL